MMKAFTIFLIFLLSSASVYAFEDCVITNDKKLSEISIEDNSIIDVYPLFTIMNEKNTLLIQPLKSGQTRFSVLQNGKNKVTFNVTVDEDNTTISEEAGFEILKIDDPPGWFNFELDEPPEMNEIPPQLRGASY